MTIFYGLIDQIFTRNQYHKYLTCNIHTYHKQDKICKQSFLSTGNFDLI